MSVTAEVRLSVTGRHVSALDLGSAVLPFTLAASESLISGTGAGAVDRVFTDERTLGASATEDLDLAGVLTDFQAALITFAKVKGIFIQAADGNTNNINISRPAGATGVPLFLAISDGFVLPPGFCFAWFGSGAGVVVTPASGDLITITNAAGGTSVTYKVIILGTSA
jgi:hypothetical protein